MADIHSLTKKPLGIALVFLLLMTPNFCRAEQANIDLVVPGSDLFPVRTGQKPCYDAFINKKGEIVLRTPYAFGTGFSDGLCLVREANGREFGGDDVGFIDTKGNLVIRNDTGLPHRVFGHFSEGLARIQTATGDGFIDRKGKLVIAPQRFETAWYFRDGMCAVKIKGKFGFIDKNGSIAVVPRYQSVRDFHEGLAAVELNRKFGFIDKRGRPGVPCRYTAVGDFNGGFAFVQRDSSCGLIGRDGRFGVGISSRYSACGNFSEGLWPVKVSKTKAWCYLDSTGKTIIPPADYEFAGQFENGLAPVMVKGKLGFINTKGQMVVAPKFDAINRLFEHGLALVTAKGVPGAEDGAYIDESGKVIWSMPPRGMVLK